MYVYNVTWINSQFYSFTVFTELLKLYRTQQRHRNRSIIKSCWITTLTEWTNLSRVVVTHHISDVFTQHCWKLITSIQPNPINIVNDEWVQNSLLNPGHWLNQNGGDSYRIPVRTWQYIKIPSSTLMKYAPNPGHTGTTNQRYETQNCTMQSLSSNPRNKELKGHIDTDYTAPCIQHRHRIHWHKNTQSTGTPHERILTTIPWHIRNHHTNRNQSKHMTNTVNPHIHPTTNSWHSQNHPEHTILNSSTPLSETTQHTNNYHWLVAPT